MTVVSYKCPNCGAELEFDPKTQKFGCEYCASQFTKEELDRIRPSRRRLISLKIRKKPKKNGAEEAVVYSCPSCGAEIVTDATTAATFCYYCHNPVVLSVGWTAALRRIRSCRSPSIRNRRRRNLKNGSAKRNSCRNRFQESAGWKS